MSELPEKQTGKFVALGSEVYRVESQPEYPRCYFISWVIIMLGTVFHALTSDWEMLKWLIISDLNVTAALFLCWIFDDRRGYVLAKVADTRFSIAESIATISQRAEKESEQ